MRDAKQMLPELNRLVQTSPTFRQPLARLLYELDEGKEYGGYNTLRDFFFAEVDTKHTSFNSIKTFYPYVTWGSILKDLASCSDNPQTADAEKTGCYDFIDDQLPMTTSLSKELAPKYLTKEARIKVWTTAQVESKCNQPPLKELIRVRELLYPNTPKISIDQDE